MAKIAAKIISPYGQGPHRGEDYAYQTVYERLGRSLGGSRRASRKSSTKSKKRGRGKKMRDLAVSTAMMRGPGIGLGFAMGRPKKRRGGRKRRGGILYKVGKQMVKVVEGMHDVYEGAKNNKNLNAKYYDQPLGWGRRKHRRL